MSGPALYPEFPLIALFRFAGPLLSSGILRADYLELWGFVLGKTTINDIQASLGPASLFKVGNFQHDSISICYLLRIKSESGNIVAIFNSGAMGGWERITSFSLASKRRLGKFAENCIEISSHFTQSAIDTNLYVGMSRPQFCSNLGILNSKIVSSKVTKKYRTEIHMTVEEKINFEELKQNQKASGIYDVRTGVIGHFRNGLLDSFTVYKVVEAY